MRGKGLKFLVFGGDVIALYLSLFLGLGLRYGPDFLLSRYQAHLLPFTIVFALWLTVLYITDLYNLSRPINNRYFLYSMMANVGLAVAFFYAFPGFEISPKTNLALVAGIYSFFFYFWRLFVNKLFDTLGVERPVVIIGSDDHAMEMAEKLRESSRLGYTVRAILRDPDTTTSIKRRFPDVEILDSMEELTALAERGEVHTVVISDRRFDSVYRELYLLLPFRLNFFQLTSFWEAFDETIPIYAARESWFLENLNRGPNKPYQYLKRLLDVLGVILIAIPAVVLGLLTAALVKITSRGPAIYRQVRVGRNEREFTIYKFRSMVIDAEVNGAQWAGENDPRVTAVGRFIRKTRLDEIPQIYNVIRGDMSFIGPRPERPEFVTELTRRVPHYHLRHLIRPGLTGWAQVRYRYGASEEDAAQKLMYDLFYVKNVSLVLDIRIALKTVLTILTKGGR